jgi:hypothetical protein
VKNWYITTLVGAVIFAAFDVWCLGSLYESFTGYSWPNAKGMVVSSAAMSKLMHGRHGDYMACWPNVRYVYVVNGKRFTSDRVLFMHRGMSKKQTQEIVDRYPVGKIVDVFYNPDNTQASVLEKGVFWIMIPVLLFSLSLTWLLPAVVYQDYKNNRKPLLNT